MGSPELTYSHIVIQWDASRGDVEAMTGKARQFITELEIEILEQRIDHDRQENTVNLTIKTKPHLIDDLYVHFLGTPIADHAAVYFYE